MKALNNVNSLWESVIECTHGSYFTLNPPKTTFNSPKNLKRRETLYPNKFNLMLICYTTERHWGLQK